MPATEPVSLKRYLLALAFCAGAGALGLELAAARLLEPWFGNSQPVWAALISLVLAFLAGGAWLGGRWGDRYPALPRLLVTIIAASFLISLVPIIAPVVLRATVQDLLAFEPGLLLAAGLVVVTLLSLPVLLLGAVTPWAIRIALPAAEGQGQTVGQIYAAATLGSIAGTLAPVLWLIPTFGTRWTFHLLALFLLAAAMVGLLWLPGRRRRVAILAVSVLFWSIAWPVWADTGSVRGLGSETGAGTLVFEDESKYNYIAVRQLGSETILKLNEGVGIHSVHHPDSVLSRGIWDYFLLAPWFAAQPVDPAAADVLLLGLAGGTVSSLWSDIYGPAPITGIELDPRILEVGYTYFDMARPNLTAVAADGRRWLQAQPDHRQWDMIGIDAYRVPYIPFHLATVEFFALVRSHLTSAGVVAINVGRIPGDQTLVDSLVVTMQAVFPAVFILNEPVPPGTMGNALVIGLAQPADLENYRRQMQSLPSTYPQVFREFAQVTSAQAAAAVRASDLVPLSDDRAPIARIVHLIVWRFLQGR